MALERSEERMSRVEGFVVQNRALIAIVIALLVIFGLTARLLVQQPVPQPISNFYDYKPNPVYSSTYRISYQIPNPLMVGESAPLSVLFNASSLVGQTHEVEVHSLNVTVTTSDNHLLYQQIIIDDRILQQGGLWGPKTVNVVINNSTVNLAPGASTDAYVSISVTFDEISTTNLLITTIVQQHPQLAALPRQTITIQNPATVTPSSNESYLPQLPQLALTGLLVGAIAFIILQMASYVGSLPRPDSRLPSGFRDPITGRAVGKWSTYKVFISLILSGMFVLLTQLGTPEQQTNILRFVSDLFLGRFDFEVTVTLLLWLGGFVLSRRR